MAQVDFYFDVVCPYAYLASTQVTDVGRRGRAEVVWKPILHGGLLREIGNEEAPSMPPPKARLNLLDMARWADWYGVPFSMNPGHPLRTVLAMRTLVAAHAAGGHGRLVDGARALYAAYWGRGEDVSDPDVVRAALDGAGLDGTALLEAAETAEVKGALRARTEEAQAAGAFGVPTFVVGDDLFFGQDRLHFVERALAGWRPLKEA